ncbi:hypothetical protein D3C76_300730 [compost metagenome]
MTWSATLLDASFRGVPLHLRGEKLDAKRALAEHGTPYRDGDDVEDLGRSARRYNLRAVYWGDNYEAQLQRLLAALDTPGAGELVHPIYGSRTVVTESWDVTHAAERPDAAEISLCFVESTPAPKFFDRSLAAQLDGVGHADLSDADWRDALRDWLGRLDTLFAVIQQYIGGGWIGLIEALLGLPGIALRIEQLRSQVLGVVAGLNGMAHHTSTAFDPLVDSLRTPTEVQGAFDILVPNDAQSLLGGGGVLARLPSWAEAGGSRRAPGSELMPTAFEMTTRLSEPVATAVELILLCARRAESVPEAQVLAQVPAQGCAIPANGTVSPVALEWNLAVLIITGQAVSYTRAVGGVLDDESVTQTLSPADLEHLVNTARTLIEGAILLQRQLYPVEQALSVIQPLRTIAALIQARARQIIQLRPPLIRRSVEVGGNLRLIAHRWYGEHDRALELLRLNPGLRKPYIIEAGEVLNAYAR